MRKRQTQGIISDVVAAVSFDQERFTSSLSSIKVHSTRHGCL